MHPFHLFGNSDRSRFRPGPGILRLLGPTLVIILLSGCAVSAGYHSTYGGGVSNVDGVVINQQISVPSGSKIYLQNGETKMLSEVKEAAPYCYFHLYRAQSVLETSAVLDVDHLTVTSFSRYHSAARIEREPVQVAFAGIFSQDASQQTLLTRFKLSSTLQPEVIGLFCGVWAVPYERRYLSLEEIERSLGDKVSLEMADQY